MYHRLHLTMDDIHSLYIIDSDIYRDQSVTRHLYKESASNCHQVVSLLHYVQLPSAY